MTANTDHPNPTKPRHRWFQFSLASLFMLLTVLCVWMGVMVERVRKQREAVEAIEALGGSVRYEYQYSFGQEPPGPKWLREFIGEEYFVSVIEVHLIEPQVTDAGLVHLKGLTNLQYLDLPHTQVTDEGEKKLQQALPNCIIYR